jgi:hypothetical protein
MVVGSLARRMLHPFDLFEVAKVGERGEGRSAGAEGAAAGRESADRDLRLTVSRLERAVSVNADPDILQEAIRERDKVTRDAFETSIQKLKSQIAALDKPNVVGSKDTVAVTKKRAEDVQASLAAIEEQIGVASRKLQLWYSRQKRLETLDALRLAAEVGASSEDVQKKKAAFEAATYDLIRTLDDVEQNQPNDDRQRDRLAQVKEKRNRLLRELQEEVRRTVDSVLAETNRHIEDLKIQRQLLSLQLETVKQDLEFARTLAEPDQDRRQAMKIKLEHNLEALQASLSDLERLVLGAGGGDPRLDERLRESARVKAQGTLESETQPE